MSAAMPSGMLAAIRTAAATSLVDSCVVSTPGTATRDAFDEEVAGTPTTQNLACSCRALTAGERLAGGRVAEVGDHVLAFAANSQISSKATIAWTANGGALTKSFQVKSDLHGTDEVLTQVLATEI